jgi:hypothetical protein
MSFEKLLLKAIDEEFSSLGKTSRKALYFHLEKDFKLSKRNIPNKIQDFTEAIESIFGAGAKILEIRIMKNLFQDMGYPIQYLSKKESLEFTEYIEAARTKKSQSYPSKKLKTDKVLVKVIT